MPKIITIHQPNYLPWLGFFHKIVLSDIYVAFNDVQFEKNSFNNRNKIKTAQDSYWLTVPIITKGKSKEILINNAIIDNNQKWKEKHLKTIKLNYSKSKYYEKYIGFLEKTYSTNWKILSQLNMHILSWVFEELDIKTEFILSSSIDKQGKKDKLVSDICKKLNTEIYISGALGKDYLNVEDFKKEGIHVHFQDYKHPIYEQLWGEFIPYMGIIDLMFNHGPESKNIIMRGNINKEQLIKGVLL